MQRKDIMPKIVFRYKRELLTFFNKGILKFIIGLWSLLLIFSLSFYFLNREKFMNDFLLTIVSFLILIVFTAIIYFRTKNFSNYVNKFKKEGIKTEGKILDVVVENGDVKNPRLLIEYNLPNNKKKDKFLSEPVTGDPSLLLSSRDVDVYILDGNKFATNFKLAFDKQRPYGKRR